MATSVDEINEAVQVVPTWLTEITTLKSAKSSAIIWSMKQWRNANPIYSIKNDIKHRKPEVTLLIASALLYYLCKHVPTLIDLNLNQNSLSPLILFQNKSAGWLCWSPQPHPALTVKSQSNQTPGAASKHICSANTKWPARPNNWWL